MWGVVQHSRSPIATIPLAHAPIHAPSAAVRRAAVARHAELSGGASRGPGDGPDGRVERAMPAGLDELFALMEEELGVDIWDRDEAAQTTPGELIAHVLQTVPDVGGPMSDAQRREYVETMLEEMMEQVLGITRYDEEATFAEILRLARRR
jgi:hypothetical protein